MAWTKEEIIELHTNSPELTLGNLSAATGYTVSELLEILIENDQEKLRKRAQSK